jgi:hypothetical protein
VCEFGGSYFRFYLLSLIEDYGGGLFFFEWRLLFSNECRQRDATQERERRRRRRLFSILLIINHGKV